MSEEAIASSRRRVLRPQLRIWLIAVAAFVVAFVVGFAIGAALSAIVSGRDVQAITGLVTLVGILATATGTVVLALKTSDLGLGTQ